MYSIYHSNNNIFETFSKKPFPLFVSSISSATQWHIRKIYVFSVQQEMVEMGTGLNLCLQQPSSL